MQGFQRKQKNPWRFSCDTRLTLRTVVTSLLFARVLVWNASHTLL